MIDSTLGDAMDYPFLWWAIGLGGISAASLPLGSALGLCWHPNNRVLGALTAYGGGALIAALTVELIAPTAMHLVHTTSAEGHTQAVQYLINLIVGALVGGILFVSLDQIVNSKGGFLRKTSATISYFSSRKAKRRKQIIKHLGASELIRHLPIDMAEEIVNKVTEVNFVAGEQIFSEGEPGDFVYFIEAGEISISRGNKNIAHLQSGDVLGEIAVVTGEPRTAKAVVKEDALLLVLGKNDFDALRKKSPEFNQVAQSLAAGRLKELVELEDMDDNAKQWAQQTIIALTDTVVVPTNAQLKEASAEYSGAPMAIWLGILLDGIPESFVIGSTLLASITVAVAQNGAESVSFSALIPYTLVAGLFLANFPEAMSSSIGMQKLDWSNLKIFLMWSSLLILTAIGAGFGYWLGGSVDHGVVVFMEGLAAGAMLTMIASAMIPEAVHLGGNNVVGLSTLGGFLSAVAFKLLE